MESLTNNNNTNANNAWESLKDFNPGNREEYVMPGSGIVLVGEAAHNARMNEMREKGILGQPEKPEDNNRVEVTENNLGGNEGAAENRVEGADVVAGSYEDNRENEVEEVESNFTDYEEDKSSGENDTPYEEIAFVQSTDLADELAKDPKYFTYLVSSERGFGVEKSRAVDACIDKMKNAEDNDQIWQAIRLGQDITNSPEEFSEEDKQRVREFMATPFARRKELAYRIASEEKALKRVEDGIQRCEREYNSLNSGNVVDKFFRRQEIINARTRLEATIKRKSDTLRTIKRQRAELQALGQGESEVA